MDNPIFGVDDIVMSGCCLISLISLCLDFQKKIDTRLTRSDKCRCEQSIDCEQTVDILCYGNTWSLSEMSLSIVGVQTTITPTMFSHIQN